MATKLNTSKAYQTTGRRVAHWTGNLRLIAFTLQFLNKKLPPTQLCYNPLSIRLQPVFRSYSSTSGPQKLVILVILVDMTRRGCGFVSPSLKCLNRNLTLKKFAQFWTIYPYRTASVVLWSEFLATDTEVPGSIPGATRFSE